MEHQDLIPHLFRTEFRKITAVLCKRFGIGYLEAAEDIAGDTFLSAMEVWSYQGIPEHPVAWLYTVARNKARNYLVRRSLFNAKVCPGWQYLSESRLEPDTDIDLSDRNIADSQLQMLFAVCHPAIASEAQVALALRALCGFGIEEIANAFLCSKETINKRLFRAREKLRSEKIPIVFPSPEAIPARLETVLTTLYLLFSEGYYSESSDRILRKDLCLEAMRLAYLLTAYEPTNRPEVGALLALMCFHASRFDARQDGQGGQILYPVQDETLWDQELIAKGARLLKRSSGGETFSRYHIEAHIAYWHTVKEDAHEKWMQVLQLYDRLLRIAYSPAAALNRIYALSKVRGKEAALEEALQLQQTGNPFYFVLLAELYTGLDHSKAKECLESACALTRSAEARAVIMNKLVSL